MYVYMHSLHYLWILRCNVWCKCHDRTVVKPLCSRQEVWSSNPLAPGYDLYSKKNFVSCVRVGSRLLPIFKKNVLSGVISYFLSIVVQYRVFMLDPCFMFVFMLLCCITFQSFLSCYFLCVNLIHSCCNI